MAVVFYLAAVGFLGASLALPALLRNSRCWAIPYTLLFMIATGYYIGVASHTVSFYRQVQRHPDPALAGVPLSSPEYAQKEADQQNTVLNSLRGVVAESVVFTSVPLLLLACTIGGSAYRARHTGRVELAA